MNKKLSILMAFLCLGCWAVNAQDTPYEERLDEVTVTVDLQKKRKKETSRQVQILSSEEISKLPAQDINDLLKYLPGIEVQSRGPFAVQSDLSIRGGTFNQVMVLIDGVEINDPLTGHFNLNTPILMSDIERIEVIKGAASSRYGPDAVAGVINIVTKSFRPSKERLNAQVDVSAGQYGLLGAEGMLSYGKESKISIGGRFLGAEGQVLNPVYSNGDEAPSYFSQHGATISFRHKVSNSMIVSARSNYDFRDFDARYFYTRSTFDQSIEKVSRWMNQLNAVKHWDNGSHTEFLGAYFQTTDSFVFNRAFTPNYHETQTTRATLIHHLAMPKNWGNLAFGLDYDQAKVESTDRGDHEVLHYGFFGSYAYDFDSSLNAAISGRIDYEEEYGLQYLPQLSVMKSFSKGRMYFTGGRSIRSADFTERYVSTNIAGVLSSGRNLGNPELSAETAWSAELGGAREIGNEAEIETNLFWRGSTNLIDYAFTSGALITTATNIVDTNNYFYAQNIQDLQVGGVDLISQWTHDFGDLNLNTRLGYTLLYNLGGSGEDSKYLAQYAGNLFTLNTTLGIGKTAYLSITGLYKQRDEDAAAINAELSPSYMVWNANVGVKLFRGTLDWSIACNNLLNEQYSDILGAQLPERWIFSKLSLQLNKS